MWRYRINDIKFSNLRAQKSYLVILVIGVNSSHFHSVFVSSLDTLPLINEKQKGEG